MKLPLYILLFTVLLTSCSDKNKSNTTYTVLLDHYSTDLEETVIKTLSSQDYSPCTNLSTSTYKSKIIRYDLRRRNETEVIKKSLFQRVFPSRLEPDGYTKKLSGFKFPKGLKAESNPNPNLQNLELYLNSFDVNTTKIFGLNSIGIEYKNLNINQPISHFQNIFDLKDALSDYICNEINTKNAIILMNLFEDTSLSDCLAKCEALAENEVCADDGNTYRNIACLKCYEGLKEISCDQEVPFFKKELLTEKAFETFFQFAESQELIANEKNKSISGELIENTMRLFESDSKVEILNLGTKEPIEFSTKAYLRRLLSRPFEEISIEWDQDWAVLSDWTEANSETPESSMSAQGRQYFKGYRKNLIAYSDVIKKNVNFEAKLVETIDEDGNEVLEWKVFIGDITIASDPTSL